jgi:hypothetical protein
MSDFLTQYSSMITSVISLVILMVIYFAFKYKINLWWLSFWYSVPIIGKMARISKDTTRYGKDKAWTNSERTLCDDYNQYMRYISPAELDRRLVYLAKAHDLGRTPLPVWLLAVLGLLVIAEGLGFSYLLGSWMAMEGSENTRTLLMFAIVLVLCVILLFVTHSAGHQLYRTNLIAQCKKEWTDAGQTGALRSANVMLNGNQLSDDHQPDFTQCINRVGTSGSYVMVIVAVVFIAMIAVVSTWMRVKHLENEQIQETAQVSAKSSGFSSNAGNPFGTDGPALPEAVLKPQQDADKKARDDSGKSVRDEGLAAFLMLAFIFVVTQIVGIAAGYKWGFAGKESKAAYAGTHGFSTYDDYQAFYAPIIRTAQAKLQSLQQRLRGTNVSLELKKSFDDFLDELRRIGSGSVAPVVVSASPAAVAASSIASTCEEAMARIDALGSDKEAAKTFINGLDPDVKAQVVLALKERKARKDEELRKMAEAQQDNVLDELL